MEKLFPREFIESWNTQPIPKTTLSTGGLLALADLTTIANRTVIKGGSTWLDALVLAPGLHYQQAADSVDQEATSSFYAQIRPDGSVAASNLSRTSLNRRQSEDSDGTSYVNEKQADPNKMEISNVAFARYLRREIARQPSGDLVFNIGSRTKVVTKQRMKKWLRIWRIFEKQYRAQLHIDWLSDLLYLASPLFTAVVVAFMILFEDWWGLALIIGLIISRILNIFIVKGRAQYTSPVRQGSAGSGAGNTDGENSQATEEEVSIDIGGGRYVRLHGLPEDLRIMCTQVWMRKMSITEGFLQGAAKLIVYLVAALSSNLTQAGNLMLMILLLVNAGLLGMSNARASRFKMHGRAVTFGNGSRPRQAQDLEKQTHGPQSTYAREEQPVSRKRMTHKSKRRTSAHPADMQRTTLLNEDTLV